MEKNWGLEGRRLTIGQTLGLAYHVGFEEGPPLVRAVAVFTAESQRYVRAWHFNAATDERPASTDRGLAQLNDGTFPDLEPEEFFDPVLNLHRAYALYERTGGFTRWMAFNSGRYAPYIDPIRAAMEVPWKHWSRRVDYIRELSMP
jgi:hypothetical protein